MLEFGGNGRSIDTNDRLADGAVTLIAQAGSTLQDGDFFTLDDGDRSLTFEFDLFTDGSVTPGTVRVPFNPGLADPAFVAREIRDAINSPQAQGVLNITAATSDSNELAFPTGNRVELFGDAITVNHTGGRFIKVDLVEEETLLGRETSRQQPVVIHSTELSTDTVFGDQLARSYPSGYQDGTLDTLVAVGRIGDNVNSGVPEGSLQDGAVILRTPPAEDRDAVRIFLTEGQTIDIDIDTTGFTKGFETVLNPFIPVISVYEVNPLGQATNPERLAVSETPDPSPLIVSSPVLRAPGEAHDGAFLRYTADYTGYFDVEISAFQDVITDAFGNSPSGDYQLTIRPQADAHDGVPDNDVVMVDYQFGKGDVNRVSPQGQIIISSNFITDSLGVGVLATTSPRGTTLANGGVIGDDLPRPGSVALLRNENSDEIVPGVVISNNVVSTSGSAGIVLQGDTNANGQVAAATVFGRIVNNTVVGPGSGDGILISGLTSPTVLNNVVSFTDRGLATTGNQSGDVVLGGNAYQNNVVDSTLGLAGSSFLIPDSVDLFEDLARRVYIPAVGSDIIDSSFEVLQDRGDFIQTVKEPVGISPSPIIAPSIDAYGQSRVDDPFVTTPGGVGSNVFIDRGAIDRADEEQPIAILIGPQDAAGLAVVGGDQDIDASFVRLESGVVNFFEVQLLDDFGTGPDAATITSENVILTENGRLLAPGQDYVFGYSSNSRTFRLTPLARQWRPDAVYEITLNNQPSLSIDLPDGSGITDGDQIVVTEIGTGNQVTFEYDSGFTLSVPQSTLLSVTGTNADVQDQETLTITSPNGDVRTLEIDTNGSASSGNVVVDLNSAGTVLEVRDAILAALNGSDLIDPTMTVAEVLDLAPVAVGTNQIQLGTLVGHAIAGSLTAVEMSGQIGTAGEGDTFSFTPDGGATVTFELTTNVLTGNTADDDDIEILRTDTPDQVAQKIADKMSAHPLLGLNARFVGDGVVVVGGQVGDDLTPIATAIQVAGQPGSSIGTTPLSFEPSSLFTSSQVATGLQTALVDSGLSLDVISSGSGSLLVSGASTIAATLGGSPLTSIGTNLPAVSDLAGNPVRETRVTSETRFTIVMPEVGFDYGDAPLSYGTREAENGARHTVSSERTPRLGPELDTETDGTPDELKPIGSDGGDDARISLNIVEAGLVFDTDAPGVGETDWIISVPLADEPAGDETIQITVGGQTTTFQVKLPNTTVQPGNVPIAITVDSSAESIAATLRQVIAGSIPEIGSSIQIRDTDANGDPLAADEIRLEPVDDEDGIWTGTFNDNGEIVHVFTRPGVSGVVTDPADVLGFINPFDPAGTTMAVHVVGTGLLDAWIDFDRSGTFESDEQVLRNEPVSDNNVPGGAVNEVTFFSPDDATDGPATWMRVRISETGNLTPTGVGVGGEVEDFQISIIPSLLPTAVDDPRLATDPAIYVFEEDPIAPYNTRDLGLDGLMANDENVASQSDLVSVRYFFGERTQHGTVDYVDDGLAPGHFTYTPDPHFFGIDTFTYRLSTQQNEGSLTTGTGFATVTIQVTPKNDPPQASDDINITLLESQSPSELDTNGLELNATTYEIPASELLAGAVAHNEITFPDPNDPTQTITLSPPLDESDQIPSLRLAAIRAGGETINANALAVANGSNQTLQPLMTLQEAELTAVFDPTGTFIERVLYTPNPDYNRDNPIAADDPVLGPFLFDDFEFQIMDDGPDNGVQDDLSDFVTATITVLPQNDAPVPGTDRVDASDADYIQYFTDLNQTVTIPTEDTALLIPAAFLLANDESGPSTATDETLGGNDAPPTIVGVSLVDPADGDISLQLGGNISYVPADDIFGEVEFVYTIRDAGINEAADGSRFVQSLETQVTSTIFVEPVNDPPVAFDRFFELSEVAEPDVPANFPFTFTAQDLLNGAGANAESPIVITGTDITVPSGAELIDGETFTITDATGARRVVEFNTSGIQSHGTDVLVTYNVTDTRDVVATNLLNSLRAVGAGGLPLLNIASVDNEAFATQLFANASTISVVPSSGLRGGETISITNSNGEAFVFEFTENGFVEDGNIPVVFFDGDSSEVVAGALVAAMGSVGIASTRAQGAGADWLVQFATAENISTSDGASQIVWNPSVLSVPNGSGIIDAETISIDDGVGNVLVVEFSLTGTASAGTDVVVSYTTGETAGDIATNLAAALTARGYTVRADLGGSLTFTAVEAALANPASSVIAVGTGGITMPADVTRGTAFFPSASRLVDGETVTITLDDTSTIVVEFNTSGVAAATTDILVQYDGSETAQVLSERLASLMRADGQTVTAVTQPSSQGDVHSVDFLTVSFVEVSGFTTSTFPLGIVASDVGVTLVDGVSLVGGETLTVTDADGRMIVFEFSETGLSVGNADVLVPFSDSDDAAAVALSLQNAMAANGIGSRVSATSSDSLDFVNMIPSNSNPSQLVVSGNRLSIPDAVDINNGETISIDDGLGSQFVVEFNTTGVPSDPSTNFVVMFDAADDGATIADNVVSVLSAQQFGVYSELNEVVFARVTDAVAAQPVTAISVSGSTLSLPAGRSLIDGETVQLSLTSGADEVIEFNTTGIVSPGVDYVLQYSPSDTAESIASGLQAILRGAGYAVTAELGMVNFLSVDTVVVGELPAIPGDFSDSLDPQFDESEQTLRVVAIGADSGEVSVANDGDGVHTLTTLAGGTLTLTFAGGQFTTGTYEPAVDYNESSPFDPRDLFTYTIQDDGLTNIAGVASPVDLGDQTSLLPGTVTITVRELNDKPTFTTPTEPINILEDTAGQPVLDVIQSVLPSMATALDEVATQGVSFTITEFDVPSDLMLTLPTIDEATGNVTFFPEPDAVGTAVYVITGTDFLSADPMSADFVPQSTEATITVIVRPVNDAPRFDDSLLNSGDTQSADEAYFVGNDLTNGTAPITYTLREDNTQALGVIEPFLIPLRRDENVVGYNRIGLLDVFKAGPDNELDSSEGGDQGLAIIAPGEVITTRFGGTLTRVVENGVVEAFLYTPPTDFNNQISDVFDEFSYTVQDNRAGGGETYSLITNVLTEDRRTTTNVVRFNLMEVNDKPEFSVTTQVVSTIEDSGERVIPSFAFDINAGPASTAFDEVDVTNGQTVEFSMALVSTTATTNTRFFDETPRISPDGTLTFTPAPDVYGSFDFEVVLTDSGIGNATRGDIISSDPITVTIDIQPVNDAPLLKPENELPNLHFTLTENGSFDVLVAGDGGSDGMLDAFVAGPPNESANINPGGNQTISLALPIPASTVNGGTLTQITDSLGVTHLRYTPRLNFVGEDSFIYTVTDQTFNASEASSFIPRFASHIVTFTVLPVNDEPLFSGAGGDTSNEDDGLVTLSPWATGVLAGPATAGDEIANQNLEFVITQIVGDESLFVQPPRAVVDPDSETATLTYEAAADRNGVAVFEVFLQDNGPSSGDGDDNVSPTQTFTIRVNSVNDAPSFDPGPNPPTRPDPASNLGARIPVLENSGPYSEPWATNVTPGPNDEQSQGVFFTVAIPPDAEALFQSPPEISSDGVLRFTPATNKNGVVDVTVTAVDSGDTSNGGTNQSETITFQVVIEPVNNRPIAVSDVIDTNEDLVLTIPSSRLLLNDIDPDLDDVGSTEQLTVVMPPEQFSVSGARVTFDSVTGNITYDPTGADSIQSLNILSDPILDSFSYRVIDAGELDESGAVVNRLVSNFVTVGLNIAGRNDAPRLTADQPTLNPNGPTIIDPLLNDTDVDGPIDPSGITITLQPAFGTVAVSDTGRLTYTPFGTFSTEDVFRYALRDANDPNLFSEEAVITISANAAPNVANDVAQTYLDEAIDINVIENDFDPDYDVTTFPPDPFGGIDPNSVVILDAPNRGDAVPQGNGLVRYVPDPGFVGTDFFVYAVSDSEGRVSEAATVEVRVGQSRLQNPDLCTQRNDKTVCADVNADGRISPVDALLVINLIAEHGVRLPVTLEEVERSKDIREDRLGAEYDQLPDFYDVNGDQVITPSDALDVILELELRAQRARGEQIVPANTGFISGTEGTDAVLTRLTQNSPGVTSLEEKTVDAKSSQAPQSDLIDLLAGGNADDDDDDRVEALDAAFGDLI